MCGTRVFRILLVRCIDSEGKPKFALRHEKEFFLRPMSDSDKELFNKAMPAFTKQVKNNLMRLARS